MQDFIHAIIAGLTHYVAHAVVALIFFGIGWLANTVKRRKTARVKFQTDAESFIKLLLDLKSSPTSNTAILLENIMKIVIPALSHAHFGTDKPPANKPMYENRGEAVCRICETVHVSDEYGRCNKCGLPKEIWLKTAKQ